MLRGKRQMPGKMEETKKQSSLLQGSGLVGLGFPRAISKLQNDRLRAESVGLRIPQTNSLEGPRCLVCKSPQEWNSWAQTPGVPEI